MKRHLALRRLLLLASALACLVCGSVAIALATGTSGETWNGSDYGEIHSGTPDRDILNGGGGDDYILGGDGADSIDGGLGQNALLGGAGDDYIFASEFVDSTDSNQIAGGAGDDHEVGSNGTDLIGNIDFRSVGGTLEIDTGDDQIQGRGGQDTISSGPGNDTVSGGDGDDIINAGPGNDTVSGDAGNDSMDGGSGTDTLTYAGAPAGVTLDLSTGKASLGAGDDRFKNFEDVTGSAYGDHLTGDAGPNHLVGGAGNDVLVGGAGADVLDGGPGADTIYCDAQDTVIKDALDTVIGGCVPATKPQFGLAVGPISGHGRSVNVGIRNLGKSAATVTAFATAPAPKGVNGKTIAFRTSNRSLPGDGGITETLKPPKKVSKALKKIFKHGHHVVLDLTLTVTNLKSNVSHTFSGTVTLP